MKNYFNLEVCFDDAPRMPYEWDHITNLMHIKLLRVSSSLLNDVLLYNGVIKDLSGIIAFTDTKESIVLKLDTNGTILKRSFLSFESDVDLSEYGHNLKVTKLEFNPSSKVKYPKRYSLEEEMKSLIVDAIKKNKSEDFSKYLYYLYFDEITGYSRDKLIESVKESNLDKNMKLYKFLIKN